jgi:ribosomal protein S7
METKLNSFTIFNYLYYSYWITKWVKVLLTAGKKETAENYTIKLFKYLKMQYGLYPYFIFNDFILKNKIGATIHSYRKSNVFYEVPFPIKISRQYNQSIHWILMTVRSQRKVSFKTILLSENIQFLKEKPNLLKKHNSEQLQTLVKSRIYQQYRW